MKETGARAEAREGENRERAMSERGRPFWMLERPEYTCPRTLRKQPALQMSNFRLLGQGYQIYALRL